MTLKIQVVSDLHLEFWGSKDKFDFIKPSAPILALLGDTCCCGSDADFAIFSRFLTEMIPLFDHIIVISGNHEYYNSHIKSPSEAKPPNTIQGIDLKIKSLCDKNNKLHYLNNGTLRIAVGKKKYIIVGSTLWTNIPESQGPRIEKWMSDYAYTYVMDQTTIRRLTYSDVNKLYTKNVKYIKGWISKAKKTKEKIILLVHHKPYHSTGKTYSETSFDPAYMSDLSALIADPVIFVGFGHTHEKTDELINGVRCFSLPKGYPKQKCHFDKELTVSIL